MALAISSSETVMTSSTTWRARAKVRSPVRFTAMPSARLCAGSRSTGLPASSAACIEGKSSVCTPTTRIPARRAFTATPMPEMRPPPPTGTTTASRSATWSSSSSPMVPWPATTPGSSKGWTKVSRSTCSSRRASA